MEQDIFDELFVDEGEVNKEFIHGILINYIRMSKDGGIIPLEKYNYLNNDRKILVVLLSKRVLAIKGISSDFASPREIQELTGLPKGTVNPTLRLLESRRLVISEGGKYKVPNHSITRLKAMLTEEQLQTKSYKQEKLPAKRKKKSSNTQKKESVYGPILKSLLEEGFFDKEEKWIDDITKRLNEKGYNIHGRKVGAVAQALTYMCRDDTIPLERKPVPPDKRRGQEKWVFLRKTK